MFTLETFPRLRGALAELARYECLTLAPRPSLPDDLYDAAETAEVELVALSDDDVAALVEGLAAPAWLGQPLDGAAPTLTYVLGAVADGSLARAVLV